MKSISGQAKIGLLLIAIVFIILSVVALTRKEPANKEKNGFSGVSQESTTSAQNNSENSKNNSEKLANNYFVFSKEAYEAAKTYRQPVFLFFYANWCPTCAVQEPIVVDTFNSLTGGNVIGFRVNYNDNDTSSDEEALAKELGVRYQHTMFIFDKDGKQTEKYLGETNKDTLVSALSRVSTTR